MAALILNLELQWPVSGVVFEETTDDTTGMKRYEDEPRNLDSSDWSGGYYVTICQPVLFSNWY